MYPSQHSIRRGIENQSGGRVCQDNPENRSQATRHPVPTRHRRSQGDPAPATAREREATELKPELLDTVMALLATGVPPPMVEGSLLWHWLRFTMLALGRSEEQFDAASRDLLAVSTRLAARIQGVLAEVRDAGPTPEMARLGGMLQQLKDVLRAVPRPEPEDVEQLAMRTTRALVGVIQGAIDKKVDPEILSSLLLYSWARVSTINGNAPEALFQKMERHWQTVVSGVRPFVASL